MPKILCSHVNRNIRKTLNNPLINEQKTIRNFIGILSSLHMDNNTTYSPIQTPIEDNNSPPIYPITTPISLSQSPTSEIEQKFLDGTVFKKGKANQDCNTKIEEPLLEDDDEELIFDKLKIPFKVGCYLVTEVIEKSFNSNIYSCKAVNTEIESKLEVVCKIIPREFVQSYTQPYTKTNHVNVAQIKEVLIDSNLNLGFLIFDKNFGDMHGYIRSKKCLREIEAMHYFKQMLLAVEHCHENGLSLRDLKLKRFTFMDEERQTIRLEGLEEANIINTCNQMSSIDRADKIACPAYVCPELLHLGVGKEFLCQAADVWACGVMLYTMILGKYPFNGHSPIKVFLAIKKGYFTIPDTVSSRAKCLIRNMMKLEAKKRWSISKALRHPWFERITYANYDLDCKLPDKTDVTDKKINDGMESSYSPFFLEINDCFMDIMN